LKYTVRLVPEAKADEILWDVCLAYRWLCQRRDASKIVFVGISSGAALCLMVMQNLAKQDRREVNALLPPFVGPALQGLRMPAAGVLFGPFVDFTQPSGALWHYQKHDLLVNQRVLEVGLPFLETHVPGGERQLYSPVWQSFNGLPDLCITVSEHETTFDMTTELINRARRDGVSVTVGLWRYMCHVFSFFNAFVPEGQQSMDFTVEWIRQQADNATKKDQE
jgi:acetyl esterase/lipase